VIMTHPEQTAAHTPGPWTVSPLSDFIFSADCGDHQQPIGFIYGPAFAERSEVGRRAMANAVLCAAAPDLLDAGRSMIAAFDPDAMNPEQFNAWSDLSAAISRAEGRTEPKAGE